MDGDNQQAGPTPGSAFDAPDPAELSRLLPAFEVAELIACGGMGAVYVARQKSLDRTVAIKVLPREFGADPQFRASFEAEAKAMARLNHPNLIAVFDFGEVDEFLYIVMEMVDGKSLHHSAHGKAIEQGEVVRLIDGICRGLAHAHEAGIIHRDIKPSNILLSSSKDPKIGDFGLARPIDGSEGHGLLFGTPDYTAPEVMEDPASADKRSDVFSTGVILYELLAGKLPGESYVPVSQGAVDPRFDKIVRRAIHPTPGMRFADAREMADEVGALKEALGKRGGLLKVGSSSGGAGQVGGSTAAAGRTPPPVSHASISPYHGLASKIAIIMALLVAIFGVWQGLKWKKAWQAQQDKDRIAEQEQLKRLRENEARNGVTKSGPEGGTGREQRPPPPPTPPPPRRETPLEVLERLQSDLARGARDEFPPGTHERDGRWWFFVEDDLSWREACTFAEEYGGHLATLPDKETQTWLAGKLPAGTTAWLGGAGAGSKTWAWIDGSDWTVTRPYVSKASKACLSELGNVTAKSGQERFPFFIQWQADGENPGSVDAQLARLKDSLGSDEPVYPPGTLSYNDGHYLIIERALSWVEARELASDLNGSLAVPGDKAESTFLLEAVTGALPRNEAAWIGGQRSENGWVWVTGDRQTFGHWAQGSPDGWEEEDTAMRLVAGSAGGWDDAEPDDLGAASAFVVEWGEAPAAPPDEPEPVAGNWKPMRAKALGLAKKARDTHAKDLLKNGKSMQEDLDFWYQRLSDNQKRAYYRPAAVAKLLVNPQGRIGDPERQIGLPPRAFEIWERHRTKQADIDEACAETLEKLRKFYVLNLQKERDTAKEAGLVPEARAIEEEIEACGEDGEAFLGYLEEE